MKKIILRGYQTFGDFAQDRGCVVEDTLYEVVKDAKARAKYILTDDYQCVAEASEPLRYSQVLVNGEVIYDFFRKEKHEKSTA